MSWFLIVIAVWAGLALGLALLIGRSIRVAEALDAVTARSMVPDYFPAEWAAPATGSR